MNTLHRIIRLLTKPVLLVAFILGCFWEAAKDGFELAEQVYLDYPD